MIGVSLHGIRRQAEVFVLGIIGKQVLAVADDGVVVFQLVIGLVGIVQESQLVEARKRFQGLVSQQFPFLLNPQILDIGHGKRQAFRVSVGRFPEPLSGTGGTPRRVIIGGHRGEQGAVRGVHRRRIIYHGVELFLVQLQQFGIQGTGEVPDIHGLGLCRDILCAEERADGVEVLRILPLMPINLRHAQHGRHVTAVQGQGFLVADPRQGVLILGQVIVSQHGEHRRGGILPVELFQGLQGFFRLVHLAVNLIPGLRHGL